MKAARAIASLLFVVAIAFVLSLPVIQADKPLTLVPIPFEGIISSSFSEARTYSELEATIGSGEVNGVPWDLFVAESAGTWCFAFRIGPRTEDITPEGNICTESSSGVGPSMFIPASLSEGLDRGVLVAAVPSEIATLELEASGDATMRGYLFGGPEAIEADVQFLVVFLPPGADIASAQARDESGATIDVSRLVDQVDAY